MHSAVAPADGCEAGTAARRARSAPISSASICCRSVVGLYTVIELNGAVEFDETCSLGGRDVYLDAAQALGLALPAQRVSAA